MNKNKIIKLLVVVFLLCAVVLTVTACKGEKMTVSFIVDGTTYATIDTSGNEMVTIPQSPTKNGYTFDGWYWDNGTWQRPFTANSLLNELLTADMSVYAKFTEIHTHSYSTEWMSDEHGHWHIAICEHTSETTKVESHTYDNNYKCKVCNYQDTSLHGTAIATEIFDVDGETLYAKVPNTQTIFSFINTIQVADDATFVVATDLAASNVIRTKTVSLEIGDNTYYVLVENGNDIQLYTVTLRRRPVYTVTFVINSGTACESQQVEEDSLATEPTTTKTGYTFAGWDYNFEQAITVNTTITASWSANEYTITYGVNGGILTETEYTATYDSEYTLAVPTREGYTFQGWHTGETPITDENGHCLANWTYTENKTVTAKWNINSYTLTITNLYNNAGTVTGAGTYTYNSEVTVTASEPNLGYDWLGWYIDDELITTEYNYKFNMPLTPVSLIANYTLWDKMTNFDFVSTSTTCTITGVKNTIVTEITVPDYVTSVGNSAFSKCYLLKVVNWNVIKCVSAGNSTYPIFGQNSNIVTLNIGDYVDSIPAYTFYGCCQLTEIIIPSSVRWISAYAFSSSANLTSIIVASENTHYHSVNNCLIETESKTLLLGCQNSIIPIDGSVVHIGMGAFNGCSSLTKISIPDSITIINGHAFNGCDNLSEIIIPISVKQIGYKAFNDCKNLTIYCECKSKPTYWEIGWSGNVQNVVWGISNDRA
ncbi:MAG: leucine-rich repeat protein [Clostridia bacterium]|nr:leucine-rich repeat protein [Clostridia bacterium]